MWLRQARVGLCLPLRREVEAGRNDAERWALVPRPRPVYAQLVLAVPAHWMEAANNALVAAGTRPYGAAVVGHCDEGWLITSPPPAEGASWLGSVRRIRGQS
jgi:hypothetical protein